MGIDDPPARQAANAPLVDEIGLHHLGERRRQSADDEGRDLDRENEGGKDRVGEALVSERRQQIELHGKKQDQDDREPEIRDGDEQGLDAESQVVLPSVWMKSARNAYGDRHHECEDERHAAKLKRERQALENKVGDRRHVRFGRVDVLAARRDHAASRTQVRLPHVALQQAAHVTAVLHDDRVAQPHLGRDLLDHVGRRHAADDEAHRIARHDPQQREDDQRGDEDDQ